MCTAKRFIGDFAKDAEDSRITLNNIDDSPINEYNSTVKKLDSVVKKLDGWPSGRRRRIDTNHWHLLLASEYKQHAAYMDLCKRTNSM